LLCALLFPLILYRSSSHLPTCLLPTMPLMSITARTNQVSASPFIWRDGNAFTAMRAIQGASMLTLLLTPLMLKLVEMEGSFGCRNLCCYFAPRPPTSVRSGGARQELSSPYLTVFSFPPSLPSSLPPSLHPAIPPSLPLAPPLENSTPFDLYPTSPHSIPPHATPHCLDLQLDWSLCSLPNNATLCCARRRVSTTLTPTQLNPSTQQLQEEMPRQRVDGASGHLDVLLRARVERCEDRLYTCSWCGGCPTAIDNRRGEAVE
uniref:4Fe-4S ferredoxin-type domain-containing protein n=1 Tax=Taenia asiatica TaxID=60517 RepID=A0A0R3VZD1_TAEAS